MSTHDWKVGAFELRAHKKRGRLKQPNPLYLLVELRGIEPLAS